MVTYNQIINIVKDFCSNHKQINSFYSGQTANFQASPTNEYPAVIMLPQPSSVVENLISLNFNIFVTDLLIESNSNLDEIYSDTLLIASDLISYLMNYDTIDIYVENNGASLQPFEAKFDDYLAGWMINLTIQVPYTANSCIVPLKPVVILSETKPGDVDDPDIGDPIDIGGGGIR